MTITRNLDGFSELEASNPLGLLAMANLTKYAYFMDDFLAYEIAQAAGTPYTFTATNCVDTIVGPTGVLKLVLGGADNDLGQLQLTEAPWQTNSKRLWFEARVKLVLASGGTVAANEIGIGLFSEQTGTGFFAADGLSLTADDALGFVSFDATATANAVMRENDSQSTETGVVSFVDGAWTTLSVYYDGGIATFYQDGGQVAQLTSVDTTSVVTPTLYIKGGEAKANELHCDYILVASER